MRKIFIIFLLVFTILPTYALSLAEIKSVCAEEVEKEAANQEVKDMRYQKMAEDACVCVGLEMPSTVSKKKFKELMESDDPSMNSAFEVCMAKTLASMPEAQLLLPLLMLSTF